MSKTETVPFTKFPHLANTLIANSGVLPQGQEGLLLGLLTAVSSGRFPKSSTDTPH